MLILEKLCSVTRALGIRPWLASLLSALCLHTPQTFPKSLYEKFSRGCDELKIWLKRWMQVFVIYLAIGWKLLLSLVGLTYLLSIRWIRIWWYLMRYNNVLKTASILWSNYMHIIWKTCSQQICLGTLELLYEHYKYCGYRPCLLHILCWRATFS